MATKIKQPEDLGQKGKLGRLQSPEDKAGKAKPHENMQLRGCIPVTLYRGS